MELKLIDETEARRDLARRRESKFVIDRLNVEAARHCLAANSRRIVHRQPVSVVRSIYFDDTHLSACHANLDGLAHRHKLRLRWYDTPFPTDACYLEIKWRDNRVTGKHRIRLESQADFGDIEFHQLLTEVSRQIDPRHAHHIALNSQPILMVEYRREHFQSYGGGQRATLDYDLAFYDQTGKRKISTAFPVRLNRLAVIEGKSAIGDERGLRSMIYPMKLRSARCSKYVHGCHALGLIHESI